MPRPKSKAELLQAAAVQYLRLWRDIDALPEPLRSTPFDFSSDPAKKEAHWSRDKNLRDVLVHLHEWHLLLLQWVDSNRAGVAAPFLPAPYTWKTYGDMNAALWEKHQSTSYETAKELLDGSHGAVLELLGGFSDAELFESKHFPWTGTTSLGSYCVSATSSHYDWAIKKIKSHGKAHR